MAWSPVPHPYQKYVNEDPNDYTATDPNLIKAALAQAGLGDAATGIFTNFQNMAGDAVGGSGAAKPSAATAPNAPVTTDYRSLIESDPFYQQAKSDYSAQGISDAAQRAQAIKKLFIDWGVMPDMTKSAAELGISQDTYNFLKSDIDPQTGQFAATNEAQGLSRHARLDKTNTQNIDAIRNSLASRGMYQSGELGYGLTENAQQYKQASTDALNNVLGSVEQISGSYTAADRQRQRDLAQAGVDAAGRVTTGLGSTPAGTTPSGTPSTDTAANAPAGGAGNVANSSFLLPAKTANVWDVNTASTNDAINAAKVSGGGIVLRPDDPEAAKKAQIARDAGVPVSIQVNGDANDTPQTLAAKVAQYGQQYPGAAFTLDLESPNFRGYAGSTGGDAQAQFAAQVQAAAPNTPITITTEGVSDFNYAAWASNPNVTFAPQCYWGDMTGRDVSQVVSLLTAQGIPIDRIVPVVAPGQSLGSWTGPVSVYGAPTAGSQSQATPGATPYAALPSTPIGAAQSNATQTAQYSPETIQKINQIVADAYKNPDPTPIIRTGGMF